MQVGPGNNDGTSKRSSRPCSLRGWCVADAIFVIVGQENKKTQQSTRDRQHQWRRPWACRGSGALLPPKKEAPKFKWRVGWTCFQLVSVHTKDAVLAASEGNPTIWIGNWRMDSLVGNRYCHCQNSYSYGIIRRSRHMFDFGVRPLTRWFGYIGVSMCCQLLCQRSTDYWFKGIYEYNPR